LHASNSKHDIVYRIFKLCHFVALYKQNTSTLPPGGKIICFKFKCSVVPANELYEVLTQGIRTNNARKYGEICTFRNPRFVKLSNVTSRGKVVFVLVSRAC
jgi:hypothetical protein